MLLSCCPVQTPSNSAQARILLGAVAEEEVAPELSKGIPLEFYSMTEIASCDDKDVDRGCYVDEEEAAADVAVFEVDGVSRMVRHH